VVNLGNAWHLPGNPEPLGSAGMRDPVFPTDPAPTVTIFSGNQYQGGENAANQLQDGSAVFFKQATDADWQTAPMIFATVIDNNKYYSAPIPAGGFAAGTVVQYYLCIAYDDHDTTFLQAAAPAQVEPNEAAAYSMLIRSRRMAGARPATVTGPISQTGSVYRMQVRLVE
jgi:hypothetical protein